MFTPVIPLTFFPEPRPDEPRPDEPRPDEPRSDEPRPAVMAVSHERSGTHFLMNALAACYGYVSAPWVNLDHGESSLNINYGGGIREELLALAARRMANIVKSHHPVAFFENELASLTGGYVIFVVCRDPVAVMLSFWRFMHRFARNAGPKVSDPLAFARAEPCGWLMRYQLRQYPSMLSRWAAHVEGWLAAALALSRVAVIRYEDLDARYEETMRRCGRILGQPPPQVLPRPAPNVNVVPGGPDDPTGLGIAPDIEGLRRLCRETIGDTMARLGY
jgi:hypothetical protein